MRTGTARVAARGSRLCVATSAINSRTWSELSWGGKQADFARVCFCTRKRQQASEALDSARAKAGTVLNFIRAFSYFSREAITSIVICEAQRSHTFANTARLIIIRPPLEFRPLVHFTNKSLPLCMGGPVPPPDLSHTTARIHIHDS